MALENVSFYDVVSSNVSGIGYDADEQRLYVRFNKGDLYYYDGVPYDVYEQMLAAESKGKFVHSDLKGRYPYGKI
jgi:hypothetical protein